MLRGSIFIFRESPAWLVFPHSIGQFNSFDLKQAPRYSILSLYLHILKMLAAPSQNNIVLHLSTILALNGKLILHGVGMRRWDNGIIRFVESLYTFCETCTISAPNIYHSSILHPRSHECLSRTVARSRLLVDCAKLVRSVPG